VCAVSEEDIRELLEVSKEILKWIKFSNLGKVKEVLETALDTDEKKIVYQMSDGEMRSGAIADVIAPHQTTIADWWRDWYKLGIAEALSVRGGRRAKKIFDLEDFNIEVPNLPSQPVSKEEIDEELQVE